DVAGSYTIGVVATDTTCLSSPSFPAVIRTADCAPAISGIQGSSTATVGVSQNLSVPGGNLSDACVAAPTYTYAWKFLQQPAKSLAVIGNSTSANVSFTPDVKGTYLAQVTVTDQGGFTSAPALLTIVAAPCGQSAPVLPGAGTNGSSILASKATPDVGDHVTLSVPGTIDESANSSCSSAQTKPFAYQWTLVSTPAGSRASIITTDSATPLLTPDVGGSYLVSVIVTDALGNASAPSFLTLTTTQCGLSAPTQPQVTALSGGQPVSRPNVGANISVTAASTDPDVSGTACSSPASQTLHYEWVFTARPTGSAAVAPTDGSASFTFQADRAGTYVLQVTAVDSTGLRSAPSTLTIPTGTCGPAATSILASTSTPTAGATVSLAVKPDTLTDSCVGGGPFTFAWNLTSRPSGSAAGLSANTQTTTFAPDLPGGYTIQAVVTDSGGFSTAVTTQLTAQGCTSVPTIGSVTSAAVEPDGTPTGTVFRDDRITLTANNVAAGSCGSAPAGAFTYRWSLSNVPPGSNATLSDPSAQQPSFTADLPNATWQASLLVTDSRGNTSAPSTVTITSSPCGTEKPTLALLTATPIQPNSFAQQPLAIQASSTSGGACPARLQATSFTYAWTILSQPLNGKATLSSNTSATPSFMGQAPGNYSLQAVATANTGVSSNALPVSISVQACGSLAPSLANVRAVQSRYDGVSKTSTNASPVTLDTNVQIALGADVTDQNAACGGSGPISVAWTLLTTPASSASGLGGGQATPTLTPDKAGGWSAQVTATDGFGRSATQVLTFSTGTCGTNAPQGSNSPSPAIAATQDFFGTALVSSTVSARHLAVGTRVQLAGNVSDADSLGGCAMAPLNTLAWSLLSAPAGSRAAITNQASPSFLPDLTGTYTVRLIATDALGLAGAPTDLALTIDCNTSAPQINDTALLPALAATQIVPTLVTTTGTQSAFNIARSTQGVGKVSFYPGQLVQLATNASDADTGGSCNLPQTLSYQWQFATKPAGSATTLANASTAAPSFVPDAAGEYDLQLTVTDQSGLAVSQTFSSPVVLVSNCGQQAPVATITSAGPAHAIIGDALAFSGSITDADNVPLDTSTGAGCGLSQPLTGTWALTALPASSAASLSPATGLSTSATADVDGDYTVRFTGSDGARSSVSSATVTVVTPSAAKSTLTAVSSKAPANPIANGTDLYTVTLTLRDSKGQALPGFAVNFTSTGTSTTLQTITGTTDVNGQATATIESTFSADSKSVTATVVNFFKTTDPLVFDSGPPTHLIWKSPPGDASVGTASIGSLEVDFADAFENPATYASGATVTVSLGTQAVPNHPTGLSRASTGLGIGPQSLAGVTSAAFYSNIGVLQVGNGFQLLAVTNAAIASTSTLSPFFNITPTTPKPAAPVLSLNLAQPSKVVLQWPRVGSFSRYEVFRDGVELTVGAYAACTTSTCTYTDTGVVGGVSYSYFVKAVDNSGQTSDPSNTLSVTTGPPPPTVTTDAGFRTIRVTWTSVTSATQYNVLRAPNGPTPTYAAVPGCSNLNAATLRCDDSDASLAEDGTQYLYEVDAVGPGGTTPGFGGPQALVQPPTNLTVTAAGDGFVSLSWTLPGGTFLQSTHVYRDGSQITFVTKPGTTYTDNAVNDDQTYTYTVRGFDTFGDESADSSPAVTATPHAVRVLTLNAPSRSQVTQSQNVSWTTQGLPTALSLSSPSGAVSVLGQTNANAVALQGNTGVLAGLDPRSWFKLSATDPVTTKDKPEIAALSNSVGGGNNAVTSTASAVLPTGAVWWAGRYSSTSTTINGAAPPVAFGGGTADAFVTLVNADGTPGGSLLTINGTGDDTIAALAPYGDGGALAVGSFTNGSITTGPVSVTTATEDVLTLRLDSTGAVVNGGQSVSTGTNRARATSVSLDVEGGGAIGGTLFTGTGSTTFGAGSSSVAFTPTADSGFVARINSEGNLSWARTIATGSAGSSTVTSVAMLPDGGLAAFGTFSGTLTFAAGDTPTTASALATGAGRDLYVTRFSPDARMLWFVDIGNTGNTVGVASALRALADSSGVELVGTIGRSTAGTNFGGGITLNPSTGTTGAAIARYSLSGSLQFAKLIDKATGTGLSMFPDGSAAVSGTIIADTTIGTIAITQSGNTSTRDQFVARFNDDGSVTWAFNPGKGNNQQQQASQAAANKDGSVWFSGTTATGGVTFDGTHALTAPSAFVIRYAPVNYALQQVRPTGLGVSDRLTDGAGSISPNSLATQPDGTVLIGGNYSSTTTFAGSHFFSSSQSTAGFVSDTRLDGTYQWASSISSTSTSGSTVVNGVASLVDGSGVFAVGSHVGTSSTPTNFSKPDGSTSTISLASSTGSDFFIAKYDNSGAAQWATGSTTQPGGSATLNGVRALSDGGAVGVGTFTGSLTLGSTALSAPVSFLAMIARFSPAGSPTWAVASSGTGFGTAIGAAAFGDGSIGVAGTFSNGSFGFGGIVFTSAGANSRSFLVRLSGAGALLWARDFGTTGINVNFRAPQAAADGSMIVVGNASGAFTLGSTALTAGNFLARFDANGNVTWARNIGGAITAQAHASASIDGSIYVSTLYSSGNNVFGTGSDPSGVVTLTTGDLAVARFNLQGQQLWAISNNDAGDQSPSLAGVAALPNGSVVAGYSLITTATFGAGEAAHATFNGTGQPAVAFVRYFDYGPFTATAP
ncbi:MAG: Ig-like domain-containing protein, partial [Deltaproteobacteria bacterium]|nr:Ig-like domain-containing protein [Deltaproteobacteria bacterium]